MHPALDGRWRYVMYDLDWVLGLYGDTYDLETFEDVLGGERNSPLLSALLTRPDMRDRFAAVLCDIAGLLVTEERVTRHINGLFAEAEKEIDAALSAKIIAEWVSKNWVFENHANMIEFARLRSRKVFSFLQERFGYGDMFTIEVINGEAVMNTLTGSKARYFNSLEIPVSPALPRFTAFDHWTVNGTVVYEPDLVLSEKDAVEGRVELALYTREVLPPLLFVDAYSERSANGCLLINPTDQTVSTQGLFLTDSPAHPFFWAIPDINVRPGEILELAGRGSTSPDDLLKVRMPFRVQSGSVLLLFDKDGNRLDSVIVP
jgi:hypothetical protein